MRPRHIALTLILGSWLAAGMVAADGPPPANLHQVGDHWTAWEPPASLPEGAEVHVIDTGDTLWDLAARYYGNPYLWPQIWERNQYILDAHWIYPGDPLVINVEVEATTTLAELEEEGEGAAAGEGEAVGEGAAAGAGEGGKGGKILSAAAAAGIPEPLGSESDIYCAGYIGDADEEFDFTIIGSEYQALSPNLSGFASGHSTNEGIYGSTDTVKYGLSLGDIVYVDGGAAAGLTPGSNFYAVLPGPKVSHPLRGKNLGRLYHYLGQVRILSVQETTAIAEISNACDPVLVGARLKPFEPEPVPLGRRTVPRPPNLPPAEQDLAPTIVLSNDSVISLGEGSIVYIDRGEQDDVTPGDLFTIYRENREGFPPVVLGELAVLSVHQRTSLARILDARYTVYVGDRLDPK